MTRSGRSMRCAVAVAAWLAGSVLAGATARAGDALAAFGGTYVLQNAATVKGLTEQAIDKAVAPMNFVTRTFARGRLRETNQPYKVVIFEVLGGGRVRFIRDGGTAINAPADGKPVSWKREDGKLYDVSLAVEGEQLRQVFAAPDGTRTNLYSLSDDRQVLTIDVTVTSPKLPAPLTYSMQLARTVTP